VVNSGGRLTGPLYQTDKEEQDDGPQNGYQQAPNVKTGDTGLPKLVHQEATDEGANNANDDIGDGPHLGVPLHDHAGNPASQTTDNDPYQYVCEHFLLLFK
jgi:hypothetical protein